MTASMFSLICNNCPSYIKERLFNILTPKVMEYKNIEIFTFLLKENAPHDDVLFFAAEYCDLDLVDIILKYDSSPAFINKRKQNGTALNVASICNKLPIVKSLLSVPGIDANLCDLKNNTPLMNMSITNVEMLTLFFNFYGEKIQHEHKQLDYLIKKIFEKIKSNNLNPKLFIVLDKILEIYNESLYVYFICDGFFDYICSFHKIEILQHFLNLNNFDINVCSPVTGNTVLIDSIKKDMFDIAEILINHPKTNINHRNYQNQTALTIASKNNKINIVKLLINSERFDSNESRLDYAFYISNFDVADYLYNLETLDVNYVEYEVYMKTPDRCFYDEANENKEDKLMFKTVLMDASETNNIEKVNMIIHHPSFDKDKSCIERAIYISIEKNYYQIFNTLIELLDDINSYEFDNKTLLLLAVKYHSIDVMKSILNNKKFVAQNDEILTALVNCLDLNEYSYEMMCILNNYDIKHDRSINYSNLLHDGKSFFTSIKTNDNCYDDNCYNDNCYIVNYQNNGSLYKIDKIVDFLLKKGVNPNIPDNFGIYPLHHAFKYKDISQSFISTLLKSDKIDISVPIKVGNIFDKTTITTTYLHLAACVYDTKILDEFLNKKIIDVNSKDSSGETPLMKACRSKRSENVKRLFKEKELDFIICNNNKEDALKIIFGPNVQPIHDRENYLRQILLGIEQSKNRNEFSFNIFNRI